MHKEACLLENRRLKKAIETLIDEFSEEYFKDAFKECALCNLGRDNKMAIYLHSHLKTVSGTLQMILNDLNKLKRDNTSSMDHRPSHPSEGKGRGRYSEEI